MAHKLVLQTGEGMNKKKKKGLLQRWQEKQMKKAGRTIGKYLRGIEEALKEDE